MTSSSLEPATFFLVAQLLNHLHYLPHSLRNSIRISRHLIPSQRIISYIPPIGVCACHLIIATQRPHPRTCSFIQQTKCVATNYNFRKSLRYPICTSGVLDKPYLSPNSLLLSMAGSQPSLYQKQLDASESKYQRAIDGASVCTVTESDTEVPSLQPSACCSLGGCHS